MRTISLFTIILATANCVLGQDSRNHLLPGRLLTETLCPIDANFTSNIEALPWGDLYFSIKDNTNGKLPETFLNTSLHVNNTAFSIEHLSSYYPYDFEGYKKLNDIERLRCLGETRDPVEIQGRKHSILTPINQKDIKAIQFIEEWQLDTVNLIFNKKVQGFIPIRKYAISGIKGDAISQTCLIGQDEKAENDINRKLIAKVKYEVLLFDACDDELLKSLEYDENYSPTTGRLFRYEMLHNPFLSSYSRNMLVEFLEEVSLERKLKSYDFQKHALITDMMELEAAYGHILNEVPVQDLANDTIITMKVWENTGYIKSVIFCEEWYVNKDKDTISKEVVGIAPVLWSNETGEKAAHIVLWFDESKAF